MDRKKLVEIIKSKRSFLCVGLDTDIKKVPAHLRKDHDPIFSFNKAIIDATLPYTVAFKPNLAFYEALGSKGIISLEKTIEYLGKFSDQIFTIADAKRGDIGNTAECYARAFFESMNFDAVTLSPFMGLDTIEPFLAYKGKWAIVLALTSNTGSADFQQVHTLDGEKFYMEVLRRCVNMPKNDQMMFVVGATRGELIGKVREVAPDHFLLVPGVGAQGGSLADVATFGMNSDCGLLVNASRSIIYASNSTNFDKDAANEARKLQGEMEYLLAQKGII